MRNAVRRWSLRATFIGAIVASFSLLTVSSASADVGFGQPIPTTREAVTMHHLYLLVLAIAAVVFVLVEGALLFAIIRFRKKSDELPPQTHGNNLLEIIWTTIPVVIVLVLFTFTFLTLVSVEHDSHPEDMTIDVQGFQFQWQFTYHKDDLGKKSDPNLTLPKDVVIIGKGGTEGEPTLMLPVGERIEFRLSSQDVIHSFYVRNFLYKLDVIPGRDNKFTVTPDKTGEYIGQCAELCGPGHGVMRFHVKIVTRQEFDKFLVDAANSGNKAVEKTGP
jgi:cytochrome c oxidase subunit 2